MPVKKQPKRGFYVGLQFEGYSPSLCLGVDVVISGGWLKYFWDPGTKCRQSRARLESSS